MTGPTKPADRRAARRRGQEVLDDLAGTVPGVDRSFMFGSEALRVGGKVLAFVGTDGELIVKVPVERAAELVDGGTATRVRIGRNAAREWVGVLPDRPHLWPGVLDEAYRYAAGSVGSGETGSVGSG
ncbi:hypothetical protein GCM10023169_24710 [Georgenia halophila]|uniref:TfoX N-terminal domain-containing protein n=1 Tax=Georgenia halophila TaxID=620889 RepID=A0ABP8LC54_9MICO